MRIVFDVSYCHTAPTGIGRGRLNLLLALLSVDQENEYLLHGWSRSLDVQRLSSLASSRVKTDLHLIPGPVKRVYWNRLRVPPLERFIGAFDLFDSSDPFAPPTRRRVVVTLHDLISFDHPEWFEARVTMRHGALRRSLDASDRIVVPSQATLDRLEEFDYRLARKATVIHSTAGLEYVPQDQAGTDEATVRRFGVEPPFILFVGTLEPRKNLHTLLKGFRIFSGHTSQRMPLVIVGRTGWKVESTLRDLQTRRDTGAVHYLGFVPQAALPALYRTATLFVYPSLDEGFGLPVLEALHCGSIVVTSDVPALRELCGDSAVFADPHQPDSLAESLRRAIEDTDLRSALKRKAEAVRERYAPRKSALKLLHLYNSGR